MDLDVGDNGDEARWVEELGELLVEVESRPDNLALLQRQLDLLDKLSMTEEYLQVAYHMSSLVMLGNTTWLSILDKMMKPENTLDSLIEVLERFSQAEADYLSIDLLVRHARLIVRTSESLDDGVVDPEVKAFLTVDNTRDLLRDIYAKSTGHLSGSGQVWDIWVGWEQHRLAESTDRSNHLQHLHQIFLDRLRVAHTDVETTSASYSSFCTEHVPDEYEERMIAATAATQLCKAKVSGERRYGATREDYEQQLSLSSDAGSQLSTLVSYLGWETDPKAKLGARNGPMADHDLCRAIFERTLAAYSSARSTESQPDMRTYYEDGEAAIWTRYAGWAKSVGYPQDALAITRRATRACPGSAPVWCSLLLNMEASQSSEPELQDAFETALSLGSLTDGSSVKFTELFAARAAQLARISSPITEDGVHPVIALATRGFDIVSEIVKTGDPALRLEKFALDWAETRSPEHLDMVLALVEKPLRARSTSYQLTLQRANAETRRGNVEAARRIYVASIQRSDLDWPEAVYEAFTLFEQLHGSIMTIESALQRIAKESEKVSRRREKMAQHVQVSQPVAQDQGSGHEATALPAVETQVQTTAEGQQAVRSDDNQVVKRDREHTTVMIGGLAKSTAKELVESFFESCGAIRETTILSDERWPTNAALLEFRSIDAVAAALAKDRRKLDGHEVTVSMLWRSTLFVTNFSRDTDDASIRGLFGNYGVILQTRWPSRKYADSRRFCYITMDSPAAAENARVLDGFKPDAEAQYGMKVLISDPAVKAKRTDAQDAVLFVGGLHAKTTEQDVTELVQSHGAVKALKLGWDPVKMICKGFAFVTMASEADANKALALHGTPYRGRHLKVEMNDPNFANKKVASDAALKEKRARTVRLNDLPAGVQEALLQQALEKIVPVRRLELFTKSRHALAELSTEADVGKLLLRTEPFIFDGATVAITEHTRRPPATTDATSSSKAEAVDTVATSSLSFAPRTAKRPGKVLGKGRHVASTTAAGSAAASVEPGGSAQDAFRALVETKNKQRETNLLNLRAKRTLDETGSDKDESKKPKIE